MFIRIIHHCCNIVFCFGKFSTVTRGVLNLHIKPIDLNQKGYKISSKHWETLDQNLTKLSRIKVEVCCGGHYLSVFWHLKCHWRPKNDQSDCFYHFWQSTFHNYGSYTCRYKQVYKYRFSGSVM